MILKKNSRTSKQSWTWIISEVCLFFFCLIMLISRATRLNWNFFFAYDSLILEEGYRKFNIMFQPLGTKQKKKSERIRAFSSAAWWEPRRAELCMLMSRRYHPTWLRHMISSLRNIHFLHGICLNSSGLIVFKML